MHSRSPIAGLLAVGVLAASLGACTASGGSRAASSPPGGAVPTSAVPTSAVPTSALPTSVQSASGGRVSTSPTGAASGGSPGRSTGSGPAGDAATRVLASMSLAQRVGQLFMVDCPSTALASATTVAIRTYHVGSVILDGTSTLGVAGTRVLTDRLQALAPRDVGLFVATDQEGGEVQRLAGPGFTTIPSAVVQGSESPATLRSATAGWAAQLRAAGIDDDLAPVLDTVPPGSASNPPIGDLDREYGRTPQAVATHGVAVVQGLAAAGVDATIKHFPGLGRVTGNTDETSGVTDTVTTRHDAYLQPYAQAIRAGAPFVMMSTAIYARIDPGVPAIFSPTIVTGMLRHDLGFRGVIITDDVGVARQVAGYPAGERAVRFIAAGGTMVLTVTPDVIAAMTSAVVAQAEASVAFRAKVDAAALLVLRAKERRGLLG